MKRLFLNFYGEYVRVSSEWDEVIKLISLDFHIFLCEEWQLSKNYFFDLELVKQTPPDHIIPEIKTTMQTQTSLSYDIGEIRYNDYYGDLISVINFKKNIAQLYSESLSKMHEVAYLIILSRVGKHLDLKGLHKLHAFAISFNDTALVCMMPSKGGKSTLLMELLKDPRVKMISDDIPLINLKGEIIPFPIKIGLNQFNNEIVVKNPEENIYEMQRTLHGNKKLISVAGILNRIEIPSKKFNKVILVEAFRINSQHSFLGRAKWIKSFKGLFKHGIIGIGLPMVIEYFWENGFQDFLRKAFIFFSRFFAFTILSIKAQRLKLYLGKKPEKAAKELLYYLEKSSFS